MDAKEQILVDWMTIPLGTLERSIPHIENTVRIFEGVAYRTNAAVFLWCETTVSNDVLAIDDTKPTSEKEIDLRTSGIHLMEAKATCKWPAKRFNNEMLHLLKSENNRTFVKIGDDNAIEFDDGVACVGFAFGKKEKFFQAYIDTQYLKDVMNAAPVDSDVHLTIMESDEKKALLIQPEIDADCGAIIAACKE